MGKMQRLFLSSINLLGGVDVVFKQSVEITTMLRIVLLLVGLSGTSVLAAPLLHAQFGIQQSVAPGSALVQEFGSPIARGQHNDLLLIGAQSAVPEPGEVFRDCPDCVEMVVVPPGEFDMGSRETPFESPPHRVTIAKSYAIARRETTFGEWDACVAEGGCTYKPDDHGWGRGNQPVIDVSWADAKSFVVWLTQKTGRAYRLPSEAEWEYAARAGTTSKYWWGKDIGKSNANCDGCGGVSLHKTMPTGSFRPNGFGLYDTSGNAYEWVADCWNDSYAKAPKDGSAWTSGQCSQRVLRGGSFANNFSAARSAARFRYDIDVRYYANGFRVVRDLQ
jgi:formylglycine-generating enzyme required for sulfatase activity